MDLFEQLDGGRLTPEGYRAAREETERRVRETEAGLARLTAQADALRQGGPEDLLTPLLRPLEQPAPLMRTLVEGLMDGVEVYAPDRIQIRWKNGDACKAWAASLRRGREQGAE